MYVVPLLSFVCLLVVAQPILNQPTTPEQTPPRGEQMAPEQTPPRGERMPPDGQAAQDPQSLSKFDLLLNGFHFENGDLCHQVEALHYCQRVNEDFMQCILFDRNGQRLLGVEYIVSEKLYKTLGKEEKGLWHSHQYEVSKGLAVAPNVKDPQEATRIAESLANTYGKTYRTFDEEAPLPVGIPSILMAFTEDGQIDPALVQERDKTWGINTDQIRSALQNLKINPVDTEADSWKKGVSAQLELENLDTRITNFQQCRSLNPDQQDQGQQGQPRRGMEQEQPIPRT